jgi:hypothetical protein
MTTAAAARFGGFRREAIQFPKEPLGALVEALAMRFAHRVTALALGVQPAGRTGAPPPMKPKKR